MFGGEHRRSAKLTTEGDNGGTILAVDTDVAPQPELQFVLAQGLPPSKLSSDPPSYMQSRRSVALKPNDATCVSTARKRRGNERIELWHAASAAATDVFIQ